MKKPRGEDKGKCRTLIAVVICVALLVSIAYSLDNPHDTSNTISCPSCHVVYGTSPTWYTQSPDPGNPDSKYPYNRLCWSCHDDTVAAYQTTHSNFVINGSEDWSRECKECHNPHYQRQQRAWGSASYLTTGNATTVTNTTIYAAGANWGSNQWQGRLVIGNINYPNYIYRVTSNTADNLTVHGTINTRYVKAGGTFAIIYGKSVRESINSSPVKFLRNENNYSFADGDSTYDGVCEVCHTQTEHFRRNGGAPDQNHVGLGTSAAGADCSACHMHTDGFKPTKTGCIGCHETSFGNRTAVMGQFRGNSHHIQGVTVTNAHCYQCHWEAESDGNINAAYHGGAEASGSAVDLVIYGNSSRPAAYTLNTTAIQYSADGSRAEIQKINSHCLSCHSDQNNSTQPFVGDAKAPKQYAWDGNSVAAKYSNTNTTVWGKYSGGNITPKDTQTKAYSAHGNAVNNQGGWDLNETWPNMRNGSVDVACFDCHNSHGSDAAGATTSYTSATTNGGILKNTAAGKGGYSMNYKPQVGGSVANKNAYNAGAGLCFDCHLTANAGTKPWGYSGTFGAVQAVMGYWDSPYFGPGTFGPQQRYPYKLTAHKGGHFVASSNLTSPPDSSHQINGLCTPCHDPHGVSPTLGSNMNYSVPMLKGTWLTAPYKEDRAPAVNTTGTVDDVNAGNVYHIDQNTFGTHIMDTPAAGVTQQDAEFAGLCLQCHSKASLTNGVNGGTWKSIDRIHESVKGWGANTKHNYTCSKCHAPHNSRLPRLMVTNCLNNNHKGRFSQSPSPVLSGTGYNCDQFIIGDGRVCGGGSGSFPGTHSGDAHPAYTVTCHENQSVDQKWNVKTQWGTPTTPVLIDEPDAVCPTCSVTLQWNASTNPEGNPIEYYVQVDDASDFSSPNYTSEWISGASWTASIATNAKWYWRAQARDAVQTSNVSSWSTADNFTLSDGIAPPQVTLISPANGTTVLSDFSFQWNTVPPFAEYLVEYSADPTFNTGVVSSGWITSTTWIPHPGPATYYWRAKARDSFTLAEGPFSPTWSFTVNDGCYGDSCCLYGCATCPTLYSWDGTKYVFETDTFPTGYLGTKTATGFRKPNPYEYHLLESAHQMQDGNYILKIVEERDETDYFDTLKLYTVDYPMDRDIYQELRTAGVYAEPAMMIHTVDKTLQRPVSIIHVNTGENVSAKLAYSDEDYLILNTDRNIDFNWQTLEFDLGDQSSSPQIKLIIDAEMVVPTTSTGMARKLQLSPTGKITRLEVLDANGNWTLVPYSVKEVFSPKERSSAYIVDITNIFTTPVYKFRLSFLYKVYVDAIFFDTTLDVPVTLTELPLVSAALGYYGFSEMTEGELFDYIYGNIVSREASYFTGNYTRYGDVTPLLTQTDDKFVIFAGGEELTVKFVADTQPPEGKSRRYMVYANGYYKATGNIDIPHTVEPLPFAAMSNYPYDETVEHYPDDAEHNQYRTDYNTRTNP